MRLFMRVDSVLMIFHVSATASRARAGNPFACDVSGTRDASGELLIKLH